MDITGMQDEVYKWACAKGWEPDESRTFGDECSLLHSEISEVLEAFRVRKLARFTTLEGKPDDVPSELADILIRIMHYSRVRDLDVSERNRGLLSPDSVSFGELCSLMHEQVTYSFIHYRTRNVPAAARALARLLALVEYSCEVWGIDLEYEFRRKMDYNYTRTYRHGGKLM